MKRTQIALYPSDELADAVRALADTERRTVSQMAAVLLEEALDARGLWPPKKGKKG